LNKLIPLLAFSILLLAPVGAQQAFAGTLYTVDTETDRLESIDTDTLAFTDIGPLGVPVIFEGLAYDPNTDTLYLIDGRSNLELFEVNRNTGQATLIGAHGITDLFGLAFDSKNNVLYGTQFAGGSGFYSLDVNNGQAAFIADLAVGIGGLAYDSLNDRLVGIQDGAGDLYEIDRANGQLTLLLDGAFTNDSGLAYDPDKDLFWDIDFSGNLFTFDPNNGFLRTTEVSGLTPHTALAYLVIPTQLVGGEILPIEYVSLILAGAQTFSWMIPVVLSVLGIGLFVVSRKSENS